MGYLKKGGLLAVGAMALTACGGLGKPPALPEGETNLSCAAMIYAATNLLDDKSEMEEGDQSLMDYVGTMTKFGTAHAKAERLDSEQVLGVIKLEALQATGRTPGRRVVVSDGGVVKRAKACYGA